MVFRDVSERYAAETKLAAAMAESAQRAKDAEEAQQTLLALMTFIPEGITIGEAPDVRIRMISQHGLELFGRDDPTLRGTADTHPEAWGILSLDHRRPRPEELPLTRSVVRGEVISNELWILRHASGLERVISCNAGPNRDNAGQITGGVIAWRDVSRQHEMEQEIRRQADALRAHDRSKDTFLSMVSHELRQPLGALHAVAQVLRLQATSGNEKFLRPVEIMERQVNHLTRLVDDLLDVARMSQGKFAIVSAPMDLVQVVREAAEDVEAAAAAARVAVALTLPSHAVPMWADAARLRQLVLNLWTEPSTRPGPPEPA